MLYFYKYKSVACFPSMYEKVLHKFNLDLQN